MGGIQGNKPDGFSAASLLATRYSIKRGNVWVVPNLNFSSIISSSRGLYGDMNWKFAALQPSDPEYATVKAIQKMILNQQVDLILNLHDGSRFYRPQYENTLCNPRRWGQCIVIDQEAVDAHIAKNHDFMHLEKLGERVAARINRQLLDKKHTYHIKNTTTRNFDHEMKKTLSYFAVRAAKAAFGLKAGKELKNPRSASTITHSFSKPSARNGH